MGIHKIRSIALILDFWSDLLRYFYKRFRFIFVILWVFYEVAFEFFTNLKKFVVRYMFWGRGKWYRVIVIFIVGITVFSSPFVLYKDPFTVETYAEDDLYSAANESDLLIEKGSSLTLIPESRPRMDTVKYTVKWGDTLESISKRFELLPADTKGKNTLMWANDISDPDLIQPGDVLDIPPGVGVLHEVESGDTLASIAEHYEASEQAIIDINWLDPPFDLQVGQEVFVPEGTMPKPDPQPVVASGNSGGAGAAPSAGRFLGWPVAGGRGRVTQCASSWHVAVDIADRGYPDIVAAESGRVVFAGFHEIGYAWSVQIDHGNGYSTWYAHMNKLYVSSGQYVSKGQAIGQMGATGWATGVHLHFEVRRGIARSGMVDPAPYLQVHICGY